MKALLFITAVLILAAAFPQEPWHFVTLDEEVYIYITPTVQRVEGLVEGTFRIVYRQPNSTRWTKSGVRYNEVRFDAEWNCVAERYTIKGASFRLLGKEIFQVPMSDTLEIKTPSDARLLEMACEDVRL